MIPILYKADEKDFTTQGLGLLSDVQSIKVTEQRNAQYYLNMEIPVFSRLFKEIKLERLVKVDDHNDSNQLFRIKKIETPSNGLCNIYAEHISRDIEGYTINPNVWIAGTAQLALNLWKEHLLEKDKVTVNTDIDTDSDGARWLIDTMENPFYCLGGRQGSILQLYGGEYRFDNLNIKLLRTRGFNTGASITYGRNMNDMSQEESIEELANSIYPFAWKEQEEGADPEKEREMIVLSPLYVDGPHIDKYAERRVMFVDFTDKNPKDKVALKKLAEKYVKDNNVGAPKVSMTVSPVLNGQMAKGLELEKFEQVNLCDIVTVKYYKLGIDVQAKVNEVTFDVLSQRFSEYKLGDEKRTLASSLGAIESNVNSMGKELQDLTNWSQQSADGKNTIFYGKDEPKANKVGDTWFKENADGLTTIHVWDGQTWKEVKTDYTEEFEQLDKELAEQKEDIDKSLEQSEQAIKDSNLSIEKAEKAEEDANKAIEEAGFVGKELSSVKETVDQQSNKITELDESTISNGKQIEEIGTGLKETITKTDEHGKQITQISKDYNGLSSTVVDIKKDIGNLELPARNLVRDSLIEKCFDASKVTLLTVDLVEKLEKDQNYRVIVSTKKLLEQQYYHLHGLKNDKKEGFTILQHGDYDDAKSIYLKDIVATEGIDGVSKIVVDVFQSTRTAVTGEVCINWIAVYKNDDKTTAWYPALEDNTKSMAELWTEVNQHSDEINLQAGQIKDGQAKLTEVELTANGLKTSVSELENMEIGGRNYVQWSDFSDEQSTPHWHVTQDSNSKGTITIDETMHIQSSGSGWIQAQIYNNQGATALDKFISSVDRKYSLSFDIKVNSQYGSNLNLCLRANLSKGGTKDILLKKIIDSELPIGEWNNLNLKGTREDVDDINFLRFMVIGFDNIDIEVKNIKLEIGNKKTDWNIAPEDTHGKISVVEQTVNGIKQTVQNKADKSEVTQLAGQITQSVQDAGATNMVMNSNFINGDTEPWTGHTGDFYVSTHIYSQYLGTPSVGIDKVGETKNNWYSLRSERVKIMNIDTPISASVMFKTYKNLDGNALLTLEFFKDTTSERVWYFEVNAKKGQDGKWQELKIENCKLKDKDIKYVSVVYYLQRNGHCVWSRPMLNLGEKCLPYNASTIHQSQITQTKDMIIQTVKDTDGKFSKVQQSIDGIQQTVKGKANQSQVTQLSGQITQTVEDVKKSSQGVSDNKTQITQNKNMINLKVSKGDVVGQLNIEAGKTLIENKKVVIDAETVIIKGKSWMDGAVIKDATIGTAQIKNASITSAKIGNIDAGKITTGYISSDRIQAKSITTDKLASNAIQVGFNAIGNAIKISPTALSFYSGSALAGEIDSRGVSFYSGTRPIGHIGVNSKAGDSSVKGLVMDLNYSGDFVSWGFMESASASTYTGMLTLDPKGKFTGKAGVHIPELLHLNEIRPSGNPYQNLSFKSVHVNSTETKYPALMAASGQNGIAFGTGSLYIINGGNPYPFDKVANLVNKLNGIGKVAIATGFDKKTGTANSWFDIYL